MLLHHVALIFLISILQGESHKRNTILDSALRPLFRNGTNRVLFGASKRRSDSAVDIAIDAVRGEISEVKDRTLQSSYNDTSMQVCISAIPLEEQVGRDYGTVCTCTSDSTQRTATLTCTDSNCVYCNMEGNVCTGYSYGVIIDEWGTSLEYFEENVYLLGRNESLRYSETNGKCKVMVGDTQCSTCSIVECDGGHSGISVTCGNYFENGTEYNSCTQSAGKLSGVFQSWGLEEFGECLSSFDICQKELEKMNSTYSCYCDDRNGTVLTCLSGCEFCNNDSTICAREGSKTLIEDGKLLASQRIVSYTKGHNETIFYEESDCNELGFCNRCKVEVNGEECRHCSFMECPEGTVAPVAYCDNLKNESLAILNFCQSQAFANTVLEYFDPGLSEECSTRSQAVCDEARAMYEAREFELSCTCIPHSHGVTELQCETKCGEVCNNESSICVVESLHQEFSIHGDSSYFQKDTQYIVGRTEKLSYIEYLDGTCSMTIDGTECDSCELHSCQESQSQTQAAIVHCTLAGTDVVFNFCEGDLPAESGVFEPFSAERLITCQNSRSSNEVCGGARRIENLPFSTNSTTNIATYDGSISCGRDSFSPGLWYLVVGSGEGIEATLCDFDADFEAQISIYTGSCGNLKCYDASAFKCKVTWFGQSGVEYYMRVHGVGSASGNFNLAVKAVNLAETQCQAYRQAFELDPNIVTKCEDCIHDQNLIQLNCTNDCIVCDERGELCSRTWETLQFDEEGQMAITTHHDFVSGSSGSVSLTKNDCSDLYQCGGCVAEVNGDICSSCELKRCDEGSSEQGFIAFCGELTVDSCENEKNDDNVALFQVFTDESFATCYSRDPMTNCLDHLENEVGKDDSLSCECQDVGSERVRLVCQNQSCLRCNDEQTICGYSVFGISFDGDIGRVSGYFEGFQYVEGRMELVAFHVHSNDEASCVVSVDDRECTHCVTVSCGSVEDRILNAEYDFDCTDLAEGLRYDGCALTETSTTGVLDFMMDIQFQTCIESTAGLASSAPDQTVVAPPSMFVGSVTSGTRRPLSFHTWFFLSLTVAQNLLGTPWRSQM